MELLPEKKYLRIFFITFYIIVTVAFFYVFLHFLSCAVLPFALAWITAAALQKPTVYAEKKLHIGRRPAALIITVCAVIMLSLLIYFAVGAALREGMELIASIGENIDTISKTISEIYGKIGTISERLGIGKSAVGTGAVGALGELISSVAAYISSAAGKAVSAMPRVLIFAVVYIASTVSFVGIYRPSVNALYCKFPKAARLLSSIKSSVFYSIKKYAASYSLIFALTFAELFFGLTLIGVKYAFVIALITAAIDILPVFGTGIVLIPWAVFSFISNQTKIGIGLIILYAAVCVIRQIAEPKIVGAHLGISPILTMAAMYFGYATAGAAGLIFAPIATVTIYGIIGAFAKKDEA